MNWKTQLTTTPSACGYTPTLEGFLVPGTARRDAVLICPGGGYGGTAPHEKYPIAKKCVEAGLHAFVLTYSVAPCRYPQQLREAAISMRLLRMRAAELNLNPNRIAILGFSAGGHLAASLSTLHADPILNDVGDASISARPDASILCYPVISSGPHAHAGSFQNLLGEREHSPLRRELSLEHRVTASTPPAFLWHTADDASVPVENSMMYAQALHTAGVPFALHCFPHGRHGLGLAQDTPEVSAWFGLCMTWLAGLGFAVAQETE